jgi:hypothetical protein
MTWVIGASSIFGAGALISDTRVQLADGTTAELLQKAYFVGNYIAAGFAGSVRIGFKLINSLAEGLAVPEGVGPRPWDLRLVARQWAPTARRIFSDAADEEKQLGSQLLLVGASPAGHAGSPFPRIDIARLAAPEFSPRFSSGLSVRHVGSGARVAAYKRSLRPLFRLSSRIHRAHVAGVPEWARQLAFSVTVSARDQAHQGISDHLHVIGVRLGDMSIYTNDMTTYAVDGPPIALRMPRVAHSWEEFVAMTQGAKSIASGASC